MIVRAWHFACEGGEDAVLATLYYPGDDRRLEEARLTGLVPALETQAPWPVVVMMPGVNVAPDGYRWLANRLVAEGLCLVTYAAIGSLGPAGRGITPGIDLSALTPEAIGTRPSATVIQPLLAQLDEATRSGTPLAELLDLSKVVVGGHSAGGTVALHNSNPKWVPGLRAVFSYAAHTMTATALGHGAGTVAAVPGKVPMMLIGGGDDKVIAASRDRYRAEDDTNFTHDNSAHDPIRRTFAEGIGRNQGDSWFIELAGAGHFSICWPLDTTSGRTFLEPAAGSADPVVRELIVNLIAAFIYDSLGREPKSSSMNRMEQLVEHQAVRDWCRR